MPRAGSSPRHGPRLVRGWSPAFPRRPRAVAKVGMVAGQSNCDASGCLSELVLGAPCSGVDTTPRARETTQRAPRVLCQVTSATKRV
eukprot:6552409-Alexandrium_andersonii.AAC.1